MSESTSDSINLSDENELDVLLTHYEQLREETRILSQASYQRILRGTAAIAVIFASVFIREEAIVLFVFLPFVLFYLFVQDMIGVIKRVQLEFQIARIQQAVDVNKFDWEKRRKHQIEEYDILIAVPNIAAGTSLFLAYMFFVWVGIHSLQVTNISRYTGFTLRPSLLWPIYIILAAAGIASLIAYSRVVSIEKARLRESQEAEPLRLVDIMIKVVNWLAKEDKNTKE